MEISQGVWLKSNNHNDKYTAKRIVYTFLIIIYPVTQIGIFSKQLCSNIFYKI